MDYEHIIPRKRSGLAHLTVYVSICPSVHVRVREYVCASTHVYVYVRVWICQHVRACSVTVMHG